jgi:hypothetical protein
LRLCIPLTHGENISFTPGFNRVIGSYLISENRFNGLPSAPGKLETFETVPKSKDNRGHPVETA